jgi:nicotinate-nucleotide adenylyltransferase
MIHAAILGGAFDPITKGHMQIARQILGSGKGIDEVWIMPCYWHAFNKQMESGSHRMEMCRLAIRETSGIKVDDYEIRKKHVGGTYYLLRELLNEDRIKGRYSVSLIIGMDNANSFEDWIEHERLKNLLRIIVIPRRGVEQDLKIDWYKKEPHLFIDTKESIMEVSSTQVRALLHARRFEEAKAFLDPGVLRYIIEHGLYSPNPRAINQ